MKIHFLQPFSYELNIGKAYNEAIENIPDEDFVCITDQDTLKFDLFAARMRQTLMSIKDAENVLLTCRTNRLRRPNKQVIGTLFEERDLHKHHIFAENLWQFHKTRTEETDLAAGVCLTFNSGVLKKLGGFKESSIVFDRDISSAYRKAGKRVLISQGIYLFHLYRWGKADPENNIDHLLKKNY